MELQCVFFKWIFFYFFCRSEKVLVVLLVASATVCFLTNLLVLLILSLSTRRKYNRGMYKVGLRKLKSMVKKFFWSSLFYLLHHFFSFLGRRVKLMLRYQLMRNQAIIGLFTAFVVVYPLKVSHKNVKIVGCANDSSTWELYFIWDKLIK